LNLFLQRLEGGKRLKRRGKLTAIDLFSGCGGLTLGLQKAGFRVVAGIDNDPLACATYRSNHDPLVIEADIRDQAASPKALMDRLKLKRGELALLAGCPLVRDFQLYVP
jgi:DNA (cytosine-5)-methyltransferase 1